MAKPSTIQIVLLPCGSTDWDEAGRLQGQTDLAMSDRGREAVREGWSRAAVGDLGMVLTAPDEASVDSARLAAQGGGPRPRKVDGLAEVDLGLWEGLLESELLDRYPKAYGAWREDPSSVTPPEGESIEEAAERILPALARAAEKAGREAVAVSLRPLARAVVRAWLEDSPPTELRRLLDEEGAAVFRAEIPRARLKSLLDDRRTGVWASAARD